MDCQNCHADICSTCGRCHSCSASTCATAPKVVDIASHHRFPKRAATRQLSLAMQLAEQAHKAARLAMREPSATVAERNAARRLYIYLLGAVGDCRARLDQASASPKQGPKGGAA